MGAYAAVNFADDLGVERSIAFSPQFSLDPAKAPFENRWPADAAGLSFENDRMHKPSETLATVVYDPANLEDSNHVALIARYRPVERIAITFAGHSIADVLGRCGILSQFSLSLINASLDFRAFKRDFRQRRSALREVWREPSSFVARRGNIDLAIQFALRAMECEGGDDFLVCLQLANVYAINGDFDRAISTVERFADSEHWGPASRRYVSAFLAQKERV